MGTRSTANLLFDVFLIFSVFLVVCFYWPNHDIRLMKNLCWQISTITLLGISFMFRPKRLSLNPFPAILLLSSLLILLTHGMSGFCMDALTYILFFVVGVYVITNYCDINKLEIIKKSIVIVALINCILFFIQISGLIIPFDQIQRPSGLMIYPVHFSILCSAGIFLAWEWKRWIVFPLFCALILSKEFSVISGFFLAIILSYCWSNYIGSLRRNSLAFFAVGIFLFLIILILFNKNFLPTIVQKISTRLDYWIPILKYSFARPLDGWGIGAYSASVNSLIPNLPKDSWLELHNEPLQMFFEMGVVGILVLIGWGRYLKQRFSWNVYTMSFIVFLSASLFHSVFHFADTLWLFILIYSMWEIEHGKSYKAWQPC